MIGDWKHVDDDIPCRGCNLAGMIYYRIDESDCGGFEDYQYHCKNCDKKWWIEGPDA